MFCRKNILITAAAFSVITLLLFVFKYNFWLYTLFISVVLYYVSGEVE